MQMQMHLVPAPPPPLLLLLLLLLLLPPPPLLLLRPSPSPPLTHGWRSAGCRCGDVLVAEAPCDVADHKI